MLKGAKKILVINLRYVGDTIWMQPFIKNLKMNVPHAEISALVNEGGDTFLRLMPELSDVITLRRKEIKERYGIFEFIRFLLEVRRKRFDTVFILTNSDRPNIISFASGAKTRIGFKSDKKWREFLLTARFKWNSLKYPHMIEYYLQALTDSGLRVFDTSLTIDVPESALAGISKRFGISKIKERKCVIVHPGARTELRRWEAGRFAEVINRLEKDYSIFLVGGPGEEDVVRDVLARLRRPPEIVTSELSLVEFAALCKSGDLFIGNDSAPIHIAAATGLFVIGLYGPTKAKYCRPWTDRSILLDISEVPCRMCDQDVCANSERQACMNIITPEMVTEKALEVLGSK